MIRIVLVLFAFAASFAATVAQTPSIEISPTSLTFGCTLSGESPSLPFRVTNTGATTITILEFVSATPFEPPAARDVVLLPGGFTDQVVIYRPTAVPGTHVDTLTVNTDAGTMDLPLTGEFGLEPSLGPNPTSLLFDDVTVGSSKELCFTVTNPSCRSITLVNTTIDNPRFTLTRGLPDNTVLTGFAEEVFCVTFSPTAPGDQTGVLTLFGDLGKRSIVRLEGRGVLAELAAEQPVVDFGFVDVGSTTVDTIVYIVNRGTQSAVIEPGLAVTGAHATDFILTPPALPLTLNPSERMPLRIRFQPSAPGARNAQIVVNNDSQTDPVIALRGNGSTFDIDVTPSEVDLGDVFIGSSVTSTTPIIVTNNSTRTVIIASTGMLGGDFTAFGVLGFVIVPVAANTSYTLNVRFAPTYIGPQTTELVGTLDNGTTFRVRLRGRGLDTAAPRPRRIVGDTLSLRVGQRGMLRFAIDPPFSANDGVTRLFVRMRVDPFALYPHRVVADDDITTARSYRADGVAEITLSGSKPLVLDSFEVDVEGLFTGRPLNRVVIDSIDLDNGLIPITATLSLVMLDGCDIQKTDTLMRDVSVVAVVPHPIRGATTLRYSAPLGARLRLIALDGSVLFEDALPAASSVAEYPLVDAALPDGTYVLEISRDAFVDRKLVQVVR